jgi:hypothetical protein
MSTADVTLHAFTYGEELDQGTDRSLGYRLLAPEETVAWAEEVKTLARTLRGAPYPDRWGEGDLFCSVLLADGQRLITLARYGLHDHTPGGGRRGGIELVGVIGPGNLDVATARRIYEWLKKRRTQKDDLRQLGGTFTLAEVLAAAPMPPPASRDQMLPVRVWREGVLLCTANSPASPDQRLQLLELNAGDGWQWLPLVNPEEIQVYAGRGPVVAWTPLVPGLAQRIGDLFPRTRRLLRSRSGLFWLVVGVLVVLLVLGGLALLFFSGR